MAHALSCCWWLLGLGGLIVSAGCQALDYYEPSMERQVPPAMEPPRELAKMSLPAYRLEPPDLVQLEVVKLVPLPPYRVETYDVLQINVVGTLLDQPINGLFLVEGEGTVNLGPAYGSVRIAGMTIPEATRTIDVHLRQVLKEPEVAVQLAQASGMQPLNGVYLIGPDGTLNLRQYGSVHVAGKTLVEAKLAVEEHLREYLDAPVVWLDVTSYNSKVYYIITEGAGQGDSVVRVPVTGNETVLDAIAQVHGLSQMSSKRIWIARPAPGGFGCEQILPIHWDDITRGGLAATNYQIMPGDRVFIAEDSTVALTNYLAKITGPVERVLGFSSLGVSTVREYQTLGRHYNQGRWGGY
jgi:polysaccharide export outer membrane protein